MKQFLVILVASTMILTSSTAYADDAWPWIVGGLAGVALLGTLAYSNDHHASTTHVYHAPARTRHKARRYKRHYARRNRHIIRDRYEHHPGHYEGYAYQSGYYDISGHYHSGYYTREIRTACAY